MCQWNWFFVSPCDRDTKHLLLSVGEKYSIFLSTFSLIALYEQVKNATAPTNGIQ